jgi:hypothetical protein
MAEQDIFVGDDGVENDQDGVLIGTLPDWAPSADDVAAVLRSRTQGVASIAAPRGTQLGRFTAETNPTLAQVNDIIAVACADVAVAFAGRTPCTRELRAGAGAAAAYRAAQVIESGSDSTRAEGTAARDFGDLYKDTRNTVAAAVVARCPLDDGSSDDDGGALAPTGRGARRCLIGPSQGVW